MNKENYRESRRSKVRVRITYGAAAFLFGGGAVFIVVLACNEDWDRAKDLFTTILPVSAAIISYWFAGRKPKNETTNNERNKE